MAVAMVLAFGSAAAGSRLLWPVLAIAAYYAAGVLLTGPARWWRSSARPYRAPELLRSAGRAQDAASVDNVDTMLGHSSPRTIS